MARWLLRHSAATIADETGLRPRYYNRTYGATPHRWVLVPRGTFRAFERREAKWYPGEGAELKVASHPNHV